MSKPQTKQDKLKSLQTQESTEREKLIRSIKKQIESFNSVLFLEENKITATDIFDISLATKAPHKAVYTNDRGISWDGNGNPPKWMTDYIYQNILKNKDIEYIRAAIRRNYAEKGVSHADRDRVLQYLNSLRGH